MINLSDSFNLIKYLIESLAQHKTFTYTVRTLSENT